VTDQIAELTDKYSGDPSTAAAWREEVADPVENELEQAVQQFKLKQAERFMQDDESTLCSALREVTSQLTQRDPAW
jgi:hypothetical protein